MSIAAAFETTVDVDHRRRLAWTSTGAIALYAGLAAGLLFWSGSARPEPEEEKRIEVLFQPPPAEPPPPPPPPIATPRARPIVHEDAPAAPSPERAQAPAPRPEPAEIAPPSGPTGGSAGIAGGGAGGGDVDEPAVGRPITPPPVEKPKAQGPINLPEEADPPEPDEGNEQPEYPAAAREAALSAVVILKIAINERGDVVRVEVLKGDEPFTGAASVAVKRWHYQPARLDGEAIAVWKIVKVTFRP